ncbi:uncharacterized protein LOC134268142 [Saccostrea cucullata]|uniref:uncharacterized protein LOC134268142 n=1 Tax=Saccostrea cuccullata TaxID=36930 RepID=UPI002ED3E2FA
MRVGYLLLWAAIITFGSAQDFIEVDPDAAGFNVTRCGPLDIGLIIDASGSIGPRRFATMLSFVSQALKQGDFVSSLRVSALTFSKRAVVEFLFNTHIAKPDPKMEILNNIAELVYTKGVTNTSGALRVADDTLFVDKNGDREEVRNMAVIITDGNSNVDRDPVQDATKLKENGVYIFGIAVGTDKSINIDEMKAIVSEPDKLVRLKRYDDLIPFRETIVRRMCAPFIPPPNCKEGEVKKERCRKVQCINGDWQNVGFYGCCYKGRVLSWNREVTIDCDTYRCYQDGVCQGGVCDHYRVSKVSDGCLVDDKCIEEGAAIVVENVCETFKCEAGNYKMVQKDCLDPNGKCVAIGSSYTEHCVTYQCQAVNGMVEFRPIRTGCAYNGGCYNLGATVMEGCNQLVCSYDDVSLGYDFILQSQGCNDNGKCRAVGDVWVNQELCIRYRCNYNKRQQRVVIREQSMGCQAENGCVKKGTESADGCIKYVCNNKGDMEIISVGCEFGGLCKAVNETWQNPGNKCANFVCLSDIAEDGSPSAFVQIVQDCHDFNGNCVKVGQTVKEKCNTYQCDDRGHLEPIAAKCSYKGRCYAIGAQWIDGVSCQRLKCNGGPSGLYPVILRTDIGCVDESGKCYLENATKQIDNSCLRYQCYEDRIMRLEVCEYKHTCYEIGSTWVDKDDCVKVQCVRDPGSGNAAVESVPYGCFMDNVCHAPGYKITKDCQEYECKGAGEGFQVIKAACTWKGGCKEKDETWFDPQTCTKYGCYEDEDGLDVIEVTYGCTSESSQCIQGGAQHSDGCNKFECVNGKLQAISMGCEFKDGCLAARKRYFDKLNCVQYACVVKNTTEGSISTQLKERWGCLDYDKCYLPTRKKTEDCTTYRCRAKTRSFSVLYTECEWMGKCVSLNTTWEHSSKCLTYKCVLDTNTGLARVTSNLWGCKDESGICHPFGTRLQSEKCVTTECQMRPEGPIFFPVEIGCKFRRRCRKLDSTWINRRRCVQQTCQWAPGATSPEVVNTPYGCRDMRNRCRPFGYVSKDTENECIQYKCTPFEIFSPIKTGCPWQGTCMTEGNVWYDNGTCALYKCIRENVGPSSVKMHTLSYPGCRGFNNECLKEGQIVEKGCTKYQCIPNRGGLVIVKEGCAYGGECKPLNSTWFVPETCTDYSCVYDSEAKDISIVEKAGCKDDGGRCYTTGERKTEGCNKFLCNKQSNFRPIKMSCEFKGECKAIDSSWVEGCITYTCRLIAKGPNFVQTNIEEIHGCIGDDGKCYNVGDELVEDCSKFTCIAGGIMQETQFGCKGFNGQCLSSGSTLEVNCVKYVCDGEAKSMVPVEKACEWKGGCKAVGVNWFDKESCRGYTCALDITDNDVKITERTVGCTLSTGECKRSRTLQNRDCVQYKCTARGELIPKRIACEWDGECADLGTTWVRNCTHYRCVVTMEGPDFVQTEVLQQRGCFDSHGHCYDVMDEVSFGCNKYRCGLGGSLELIDSGCMDKYGRCMKPGEIVEDADGSTHKCVCDGSSCLVVTEVKGCMMNGTLYPFGQKKQDGCTVYECQNVNNCGKFVPIQWGCYWVDRCYSPGEKWKSQRGCSIFTCTMNQKPSGDVDMIVSRDIGCPFENECKEDGEQWRDGCFEKKCKVRTNKDNSKESAIKIVSGGCQEGVGDSMICHPLGSIWEEHHYDGCFKKQCKTDPTLPNKFITMTVGASCRDAYGTCRPVGSTGFDAYVNGQLREECTCSPKDGQVNGVQYTCKAKANPFECEGC